MSVERLYTVGTIEGPGQSSFYYLEVASPDPYFSLGFTPKIHPAIALKPGEIEFVVDSFAALRI